MPKVAIVLIVASLSLAPERKDDLHLVRRWIQSARQHRPGAVDKPLLDMSVDAAHYSDLLRRMLRGVLRADFDRLDDRNDVLRRGALLHMDIALLLPRQAAEFTLDDLPPQLDPYSARPSRRRDSGTLVYSIDGEYVTSTAETGHLWLASTLLTWILPHPPSDPFVPMWYRALAAHFEGTRRFGSAQFHLLRALEVLPDDPVLLFYAGAMHEALASAGVQSVAATRPEMSRERQFPSAQDEWHHAERLLRKSAAGGGPDEARLRLARVLGHLGKHSDAATLLRPLAAELHDRRLRYLAELFLGTEEGALGHLNDARASFERAAEMFPTAQSPLLGLSDLYRTSGDLASARRALQRLEKLPTDRDDRKDPWREYYESFAADGDQQLAAVRAWVDRQPPR